MNIFGFNISGEVLLVWVAFGIIIGLLVTILDQGEVRGGFLGTMVAGILGAVAGGILANVILGLSLTAFSLESLLVVLGGAVILVLAERLAFRKNGQTRTKITRLE